MLKFSKTISSKSKNIVKENSRYFKNFHLLKWMFQNELIIWQTCVEMAKALWYLLLSNRQRCGVPWERLNEHLQRCWVCDPAKIFLTSKFSLYSFSATPHIKFKLGPQIGGGLLIANHLDQSVWWANRRHWAAVRSYYYSLFCRCIALLRLLPAFCVQLCRAKTNFLSQTGMFWLFFI
jgi:hypothetical protein